MAAKHPNADNPTSVECSCGWSVASTDPDENKARLAAHQKQTHKKAAAKS